METVKNQKRSNISVSQRTKDALDSIRHAGQSYDGVIQELTGFWKSSHINGSKRKKEGS
jgi:hypothetical protein